MEEERTITEIAHFIDNARVSGASGRSQPVYNPATGEAEKTVALASAEEVRRAVASARAAWPNASRFSLSARSGGTLSRAPRRSVYFHSSTRRWGKPRPA